MALAKIGIVIGAGIVGSIFANGGGLSDITNVFTGALRVVTKHLQQDKGNSQSGSKPQNDLLLSQVNHLRRELQLIQSSRPVTIIAGSGSGSRAYSATAIIVVGVASFFYIKWKGWKISDMMFVTRRGLSDACNTVGKQLELVSSSVSTAKRHLSSRIDRVDCNLDECKEIAIETKEEVSELHGKLSSLHTEVTTVHHFVKTLESKLGQIEGKQEITVEGVYRLCHFAEDLERRRSAELIQELPSSSRQAIELPPAAGIVTRTDLLPSVALEEPSSSLPIEATLSLPSPSVVPESPRVLQSSTAISASGLKVLRSSSAVSVLGLKDLQEFSTAIKSSNLTSPKMPEGTCKTPNGAPSREKSTSSESSSSRFGWKLPVISILSRSRSAATS